MRTYFTTKIGQALHRTVTSGKNEAFGPAPYARQYRAEILKLEGDPSEDTRGLVLVNLTSEDIHPSGSLAGGTYRYRGDILVNLDLVDGLETFWQLLIEEGDPEYGCKFFRKGRPARPTH